MSWLSSLVGSVTGSNQRKATNQAVDAQNSEADKAIALAQQQFAQTQANQQPFITAGQNAVGQQGDLLGLNGADKQQAAITALQSSPLFTSLFNTGQNAVLANGAATGSLRGGNTQNSLANFGANTLASVFQNQVGNLGSVAGQGTNTATNLGSQGAANAANIGNLYIGQGANTAGGILSNAASTDKMWSDLIGNFGKQSASGGSSPISGITNILSSLFGSGGGVGGSTELADIPF